MTKTTLNLIAKANIAVAALDYNDRFDFLDAVGRMVYQDQLIAQAREAGPRGDVFPRGSFDSYLEQAETDLQDAQEELALMLG